MSGNRHLFYDTTDVCKANLKALFICTATTDGSIICIEIKEDMKTCYI